MNASLGYVTEVSVVTKHGVKSFADSQSESFDGVDCCLSKAYSCFLTLFYDFLGQSRYADVNEPVYVKSIRPQLE